MPTSETIHARKLAGFAMARIHEHAGALAEACVAATAETSADHPNGLPALSRRQMADLLILARELTALAHLYGPD